MLDINRIECLIFDLDGTLVDSELLCLQAYCDTLPDLEWDANYLMRHFRGWKLDLITAELEKELGRSLPRNYESLYRARVTELFEAKLTGFPGADETLSSLRYPKCIASSGPLKKMRHSLALSGLAKHFGEALFSAYEVGSWKPDPGLFRHAAAEMGYEPEACLVIEDSPVGIAAAKAAGMQYLLHCPEDHEIPDDYRGPVFAHYESFPLL